MVYRERIEDTDGQLFFAFLSESGQMTVSPKAVVEGRKGEILEGGQELSNLLKL